MIQKEDDEEDDGEVESGVRQVVIQFTRSAQVIEFGQTYQIFSVILIELNFGFGSGCITLVLCHLMSAS